LPKLERISAHDPHSREGCTRCVGMGIALLMVLAVLFEAAWWWDQASYRSKYRQAEALSGEALTQATELIKLLATCNAELVEGRTPATSMKPVEAELQRRAGARRLLTDEEFEALGRKPADWDGQSHTPHDGAVFALPFAFQSRATARAWGRSRRHNSSGTWSY
jgi:hypothetical protein